MHSSDSPSGLGGEAGGTVCRLGRRHWHWPPRPGTKRINIALQGGGAHGAFAAGVIEKLLEDGRIEIESISGTSAGAVNAVVLAEGLVTGGPEHARRRLTSFWRTVSREALASPIQRTIVDSMLSRWSLDYNPALAFLDMAMRVVSPYQFNPLNLNPLRDLLRREVDFEAVAACDCIKLFISATNVASGRVRVFSGRDVTADAVMASACLPDLFQAVEIDGEPYWDGGYMGNPVLFPFLECCSAQDVLLVQSNPIARPGTPRTARAIMDRVHEISFNSCLIKELRHIDFVNRCLRRGDLKGMGYREIHMHQVAGGPEIESLTATSKLNAEWAFLAHLMDEGRKAAARWLETSFDKIGREGTMDLAPYRAETAGLAGLRSEVAALRREER